jgi:aspartate aminotransferase-like enzyme
MYALDYQLDRIMEEGLENRFARHRKMASIVREWAKSNFALFPEEKYASDTVTCVRNTKGISVGDLNKKLGENGYVISNGYGDLKEVTFRIAHMGDATVDEITDLLATIDRILA